MGKLGIKAKIYYRSSGTFGSPTFTEITGISDLSVNPVWEKGSADSRASRMKRSNKTMLQLTVTGNLKKVPGNAAYEAIMNALVSEETIDILVLDGAKDEDGSRGWRFDSQIFEGTEDHGLAVGAIMVALSIEPCDSDNEAQAVYVSGSSLTYATPGEASASFA